MTLLIGADPELFLKQNGAFVSAFGMVPGTKQSPYQVPKGAVQVDGMALEFNIDPAIGVKEFVHNITSVLGHLRNMVPEDFDFAVEAVAHFDKAYLKAQPALAVALGCEPDFDAYLRTQNEQPDHTRPMRTAAGHLHIGWCDDDTDIDDRHMIRCGTVTKQLDYILGIPSIVLDREGERREMYGKAGTFRPKPYGVEYRVLSNFWLQSATLMEWVFKNTSNAFNLLSEKGVNLSVMFGDKAKDIINNNDLKAATKFLEGDLRPYVDMEGIV